LTDLEARRRALGLVGRLPGISHPNRTVQRALARSDEERAEAADGRGEGVRTLYGRWIEEIDLSRFAIRNPVGRYYNLPGLHFYASIARLLWKNHDQRRALLAEVQAKIAEAEKKEAGQPPPTAK
jgi:hypothetical protein